jgi:hypothetical protein
MENGDQQKKSKDEPISASYDEDGLRQDVSCFCCCVWILLDSLAGKFKFDGTYTQIVIISNIIPDMI